MKQIKTYELFNLLKKKNKEKNNEDIFFFNINDYILLKNVNGIFNYLPQHLRNTEENISGKIIDVDKMSVVEYYVLLENSIKMWIPKRLIIRTLNETEIDLFELKIDSNKYNL